MCVPLDVAPCAGEFFFMKPSFDEPPGRVGFNFNDVRNGSVETYFYSTQARANVVDTEPFKCLSPAVFICGCGLAHFFLAFRSLTPGPPPHSSFDALSLIELEAAQASGELPLDYMLRTVRDPFIARIAREPNTMLFCRPSKLFAFQILMCGSSCRTTFNNELWTSNPVPL